MADLDEAIRRGVEDRLSDLHTATLGRVEKFDSTNWTADVKPLTRRAVPCTDGGVLYEDQPVIPGAIVLTLGTTRSFVQVPLEPGDLVWLQFAESSLSEVLESESLSDPLLVNRHSLTTPLAIPVCLPGKASGGGALASLASVQSAIDAVQQAFDVHTHTTACTAGGAAVPATTGTIGAIEVEGTLEVIAK